MACALLEQMAYQFHTSWAASSIHRASPPHSATKAPALLPPVTTSRPVRPPRCFLLLKHTLPGVRRRNYTWQQWWCVIPAARRVDPEWSGAGGRCVEVGQTGESVHLPSVPTPLSPAAEVAFDALYRNAYRQVLQLAYVLSGSWPVAEDVTQEAFLRLMGRIDRIDNPDGYVRQVAANLARSHLRRKAAEVRALGRLAARPSSPPAGPERLPAELDRFWAEVRRLPRRQAQAIAYHYLEDRPIREVATLMVCSEGTAKALLYQARKRLSRQLGDGEVAR